MGEIWYFTQRKLVPIKTNMNIHTSFQWTIMKFCMDLIKLPSNSIVIVLR